MNILAIVQARMGSSRLPGKVMAPINGVPMIELLLSRLSGSDLISTIVVATSNDTANRPLVEHVTSLKFACEQGSETDVLSRYAAVASKYAADTIIRITGDCPLIDYRLVDECIKTFLDEKVDYLSNNYPPTFPDGLDVEIFTKEALFLANSKSESLYEREHVTPYLRRPDLFRTSVFSYAEDLSSFRWTVDEAKDLEVVRSIFKHFYPNLLFSWNDVLELQKEKPFIFEANQDIPRNQGSELGEGQKLWKRAKQIIPGGNMLLSKRPEMFLPERWPTYFSQASGCRVKDLDGTEYIDMSIMGIGTNTLGYGHPEVDSAVVSAIRSGNMSSLNCPEEVYLAERLIELHPWADMARFARSGGEANAIAIRIGRAASGRDKVAFCGYHGWHDWYLSANLGDKENLGGHLLPGLDPRGVPKDLGGSALPFTYNDFSQLEKIIEENDDVGVIKMEVARNQEPTTGFLEKIREIATEKNIVLIFDECTSGFRETFGGLHKKYGVEPDIAMFGKALGNGYAVTAAIGRQEVMEAAQSTFISSTFWTERIGSVAALKTLEVMEREKSWIVITEIGLDVRDRWQEMANKHELKISHWGLPSLAGFTIQSENALAYKTLITQELLQRGFLAGTTLYASTAHTTEIIAEYFSALDPVFELISQCENGRNVYDLLKSPICHSGFRRLN
ncbi:aminotransferase class III-fold pyridoxal phosphate-dependent enzyme [Arenicellales bacterium IMCC55707]